VTAAVSHDDDLWALRRLANARRLTAWMFSVLAPSRPGPAVEIGAGVGTFSRLLLDAGAAPLLLLEPEPACYDELLRLFAHESRVQVAREGIPASSALDACAGSLAYALCQNVLEHIEDDLAALESIAAALRPDGELALLVPAHPALYGRLDRRFEHHRRYTRERLRTLLRRAGFELDTLRSFNLLGVPGWWLAGRTSALDIMDGSLRAYEMLLRAWRPVEDRLHPPVGLSLVARARKRTG
jgi:SAM-dependent methyltransferase